MKFFGIPNILIPLLLIMFFYCFHKVTYHIKDNEENEGKDYFVIDKNTGEIFTKVVLDRETKAVYILDIEARDGAISATAGIDKPNSGMFDFQRLQ